MQEWNGKLMNDYTQYSHTYGGTFMCVCPCKVKQNKRTNIDSTFEMEYFHLTPPSQKKKDGHYVILGNFVIDISSILEYSGQQICFTDPKTMSQHFFY